MTKFQLVLQLVNQGRKVVFAGDDTWIGLFPDRFSRAYPYPSFDVWDLVSHLDKFVDLKIWKTEKYYPI